MVEKGQIVRSLKGRDCGKYLVVIGFLEGKVLIADGKERPIENPKLKNLKHLSETNVFLKEESYKTNRSLRHALNDFCAKNKEKGV